MSELLEEPALEEAAPAAVPQLAEDGIGVSLEEVRNLLSMKHNTIVSPDDPILMLVTLNNAFLAEYEKLHAKHEKAMLGLMGAEAAKIQAVIGSLEAELSRLSVEGVAKVAGETLTHITNLGRDVYWLSLVVVISAVVNLAVFIFGALR